MSRDVELEEVVHNLVEKIRNSDGVAGGRAQAEEDYVDLGRGGR